MQIMNPNNIFKALSCYQFTPRKALATFTVSLCSLFIASCGNSDAESQVKKFCSQVKTGEPIMNVVNRAEKVDFDKYWLEKFNKEPSKGENIGIIRPRDLGKKTEKLQKLKDPKTWDHGQFNAMIQELGYSRHVCAVNFAKDKVRKKKVYSVD
jgi:hypothetical protein